MERGDSFPWPLGFIDVGVQMALKELSTDFGPDDALPVSGEGAWLLCVLTYVCALQYVDA